MIRALILPLILLTGVSANPQNAQHICPKTGERPGHHSKLGIILCFQDIDAETRHLDIPSPDGSIVLQVDGRRAKLMEGGKQLGPPFEVFPDEEILWSPDSRAIIDTLSFGALGPVVAGLSYVHPRRAEMPPVTKTIQKDFASRYPQERCSVNVNVGGLTWEEGSKRAVFLAEVPSSSSCGGMMGRFEAYVVSIPEGKILAHFSQRETIARWHQVLADEMLEE